VPDERRHLDLVHREDQPGRAAAAAELEARLGDGGEGGSAPAERLGDERGQQALFAEGVDRLAREPRRDVHVVGMDAGDLLGDPPHRVEHDLVGPLDRDHEATLVSSRTAAPIDATLSNICRVSMLSGNSRSNASSSASITLTLACEVIPAW
jgi:hypothetical protein